MNSGCWKSLLLVLAALSYAHSSVGQTGEFTLRVYHEYQELEMHYEGSGEFDTVLLSHLEFTGGPAEMWKGGGNGIDREYTGDIVTHTLYVDDVYQDSCDIPYGEGECYLVGTGPVDVEDYLEVRQITATYGKKEVEVRAFTKKPGADLEVEYFQQLSWYGAYCGIPSSWFGAIRNIGKEDVTEPFKISVYVNGKEYAFHVDSLKSGDRVEIELHDILFDESDGCNWDTYYPNAMQVEIKVVADSENSIEEFDEENNVRQQIEIFSGLRDGAYVLPGRIILPQKVKTGEPFPIEYSISNAGKEDVSSSFNVKVTYSCCGGKGELDEVRVNSIVPGETKYFYKEENILDGKCCSITLIVDPDNEIPDNDSWFGPMPKSITKYGLCEDDKTLVILSPLENETSDIFEIIIENETAEPALCKNVSCPDYCSGKTLYSSGKCNPETGKCAYPSKQCENGCDSESARCIETVENPQEEVVREEYLPPVRIQSITIDPNPAQAYEKHEITISVSDENEKGPAHFYVEVPEGTLSYGTRTAPEGEPLEFDTYDKTVHVWWQAPGRGLNEYEFEFAGEIGEVKRDSGISMGASLAGVAFPIVKTGETAYGMYRDLKDISAQIDEYGESRSTNERIYRGFDIALSGVKIVVGGIEVGLGTTAVGGLASELLEDYAFGTLDATQVYLEKEAAEERNAEMEKRMMSAYVKVRVVDSEGNSDSDYLAFVMEYLWEKEHSGGESW